MSQILSVAALAQFNSSPEHHLSASPSEPYPFDRPSEHYPVDMVRPEPSMVTIVAGLGTTLVREFNVHLAGRRFNELRPDAITAYFYRSLFESSPDDPFTCGVELSLHAGLPKPSQFNVIALGLQFRSLGVRTDAFGMYTIATIAAEQVNVTLHRQPRSHGDTGPTTHDSHWLDMRCDIGLGAELGVTTRESRMKLDPFTERKERHGIVLDARVGYSFSPYATDWQQSEILGFRRPEALTPAFYATIRIGSRFTVQE